MPHLFEPIFFNTGLNVILAEIRLPDNQDRDTHNLGKTLLGRLIDFCFWAKRNEKFFLFKHLKIFNDFIFYLEIELDSGAFVTIRRSVANASKASFQKHESRYQDYSELGESDWDHYEVSFERAKTILDSLLNWQDVKPWDFRKGLGYQLRSQKDYGDVAHLSKFKGLHADWKPLLSQILGFDSKLISSRYKKEAELEEKQATEKMIKSELGGSVEDSSKIDGVLLLKLKEVEQLQQYLSDFDFHAQDEGVVRELVDEIDSNLSNSNNTRYSLGSRKKKVELALRRDQILFDPNEAQKLFEQAGVLFSGQIKKDYEQLIEFNKSITDERRIYLEEERTEIESELREVNNKIRELGHRRSESLSFLSDTDVFTKYKSVTDEAVSLKADIEVLERQRESIRRLQELCSDIRILNEDILQLQTQIEQNVDKQSKDKESNFSSIRLYFSEIIEHVIGRKALLIVSPNTKGHLEFNVEILNKRGNPTSANDGFTYEKLLCIAFDLAVLRSHLESKYPRFVYHDGIFESLDDRKKLKLLEVIREYADFGLQCMITLIDTDLPKKPDSEEELFSEEEIILSLHDEGDSGRLFKMPAW
ncbi:MAG: DUF2326 domain-containing protein [Phycisphaerales bacterium]|nr:DUF2326 domain-containing protein [Phycisphaerales bacterium]